MRYRRGMVAAPKLPPITPDNSPEAAAERGARVLRQLAAQGIPVESLDEQLTPEQQAAALAWMRGEGPCPSIG